MVVTITDDHCGWYSVYIIQSIVHYYIIDLSVRAILAGANTGDRVKTRHHNKQCPVILMIIIGINLSSL